MNTNPVNLAVRFLLEIAMLVILSFWGWHFATTWVHVVYAVGFPVIAATLWGVFRIPNDPKPAPVAIPGVLRLLLELALFALTVWALFIMQHPQMGYIMATVVVLHYLVSYDRTWAMLRNKPYNGFVK